MLKVIHENFLEINEDMFCYSIKATKFVSDK